MTRRQIRDPIRDPIHPGEILEEDFLKPLGISQRKLAVVIGVPPRRINEIVHGERAITADTALRLARALGMSPEFWLGIQAQFDLESQQDRIADQLADIQPLATAS